MLEVTNLSKEFSIEKSRKFQALNNVSISVEKGSIFTLLGPSGCGKSTLLRSIAGLEDPDQGTITLENRDLFNSARNLNISANKRHIGMVFQSYAIWPHMTVFENVAFPLKVPGSSYSKAQIMWEVERALAIVQLENFAGRQSTKLSGGQQQRLALARAIVIKPQLLLLDEPLSNLDAKLRESLRFELKKLQRELGITTIYVTHDQNEALALSDMIAVMKDGEIQQIGTPREIYNQPCSSFVADFVGTANFMDGIVDDIDPSGSIRVMSGIGPLICQANKIYRKSDSVLISFRPEDIVVHDGSTTRSSVNTFRGKVTAAVFSGDYSELRISVQEHLLRVKVAGDREIQKGQEIEFTINPRKTMIVEKRAEAMPNATASDTG
jgi:iron(III) transport system ATP-binding protein